MAEQNEQLSFGLTVCYSGGNCRPDGAGGGDWQKGLRPSIFPATRKGVQSPEGADHVTTHSHTTHSGPAAATLRPAVYYRLETRPHGRG